MENVKDHLFCNASFKFVNKLTVLSKHVEQWRNKALHGQWPTLMEELAADSFTLRNAYLKRVTESLLIKYKLVELPHPSCC